MKLAGIFLSLALAASAQTNEPSIEQTNTPPAPPVYATTPATNTPPVRALSLQDCVQMALEHNLDIKIERYNPQLSLYTLAGAYAGYDPVFTASGEHTYDVSGGGTDPVTKLPISASIVDANRVSSSLGGTLPSGLTYNFSGNLTESYGTINDNTRGQIGVTMSQPLLKNFWIDSTRLTILISRNRLKSSEQGLRLKIMDIVTLVEQAYYDLIAARENVKVLESALLLADQLVSENKKRVEVGALAPLDEKQAESQAAGSRADLLSARQLLSLRENTLKELMTDNYRSIHDVEFQPAESLAAPVQLFNLQDSWSKGVTQRPDLIQSKLDLEQEGIQLRFDRNQLFPQLDVFGSFGYGAGGAGVVTFTDGMENFRSQQQPFHSYGAQFSIPLSNKGAREKFKSTKTTVQQRLLTFKKLEQTILVQIDNDIKQAQADYERVDATRAAREYAEAALDAEQKKLQSGKSTSFFVLQLQRDLTSARSTEIQALADYNKALAQLAHDEGSTFQRRAIDVRVK